MARKVLTYLLIIGSFVFLISIILKQGNQIERTGSVIVAQSPISQVDTNSTRPVVMDSGHNLFQQLISNIQYPLSILLLQLIIILLLARLFGIITRKLGQQTVIGEILAGIFLGPSLLGWLFPGISAFLFPPDSLISLQFLSQIGLAFFMFVIGMELDVSKLRGNTQDAIIISHASIILPFFLGTCLSYFIFEELTSPGTAFTSFALFMGIAMSITAFPVLARILKERGLTRSPLGVLAITCAAADDVTAWCLLAIVIAIAKAGSVTSALFTIVLAISYILFALKVIKPWLQRISDRRMKDGQIDKTVIAFSFLLLLISAYFTEIIGIHALFGSFLAGVMMPNNIHFKESLTDKIEDISTVLLLPIFFAFTGLRTQIGLLNTGHLWALGGIIILIAIIGKFGGSSLTAKLTGRSWKESLSIGALMNTRGLMELVVLNIGYDLKILGPEIFAIMVIMALVTTLMTGPLLDLINYAYRRTN